MHDRCAELGCQLPSRCQLATRTACGGAAATYLLRQLHSAPWLRCSLPNKSRRSVDTLETPPFDTRVCATRRMGTRRVGALGARARGARMRAVGATARLVGPPRLTRDRRKGRPPSSSTPLASRPSPLSLFPTT
eukprot:366450-Chlamydomonas_euryale.AAC.15